MADSGIFCFPRSGTSRVGPLLLGAGAAFALHVGGGPAYAVVPQESGVPLAESPLMQKLLAESESKREERAKERLDDYYRRNFTDYFNFDVGSQIPGKMSAEAAAEKAWLERNK